MFIDYGKVTLAKPNSISRERAGAVFNSRQHKDKDIHSLKRLKKREHIENVLDVEVEMKKIKQQKKKKLIKKMKYKQKMQKQ